MLNRAFIALFTCSLLGCPGGDGGIGDTCSGNESCESSLQCVSRVCVPLCQRAPECGDGFACSADGHCVEATGQNGDACHSEVECSAGLACHPDGATLDAEGLLSASCIAEQPGKPTSAACAADADCRDGTCALGHCVDLCASLRDCAAGTKCMTVPRVEAPASGAPFAACLPATGNLAWSIPVTAPSADILVPIPSDARSATLVFAVDDVAQRVGATRVSDPAGIVRYTKPCQPNGTDALCSENTANDQFFGNAIRHLAEPGQSVFCLHLEPDEVGTLADADRAQGVDLGHGRLVYRARARAGRRRRTHFRALQRSLWRDFRTPDNFSVVAQTSSEPP